MTRSPARIAELTATRNKLNALGYAVASFTYALGTRWQYDQGTPRNAKRIRIRNKINAILARKEAA